MSDIDIDAHDVAVSTTDRTGFGVHAGHQGSGDVNVGPTGRRVLPARLPGARPRLRRDVRLRQRPGGRGVLRGNEHEVELPLHLGWVKPEGIMGPRLYRYELEEVCRYE